MTVPTNSQGYPVVVGSEGAHHEMYIRDVSGARFDAHKMRFETEFADWIASKNEHFEACGLWCEGLVPWMSVGFDDFAAD